MLRIMEIISELFAMLFVLVLISFPIIMFIAAIVAKAWNIVALFIFFGLLLNFFHIMAKYER